MELTAVTQEVVSSHEIESSISNNNRFIEANTQQVSLSHLRKDCVIPVFAKDNESTIPHFEFIDAIHKIINSGVANFMVNLVGDGDDAAKLNEKVIDA